MLVESLVIGEQLGTVLTAQSHLCCSEWSRLGEQVGVQNRNYISTCMVVIGMPSPTSGCWSHAYC